FSASMIACGLCAAMTRTIRTIRSHCNPLVRAPYTGAAHIENARLRLGISTVTQTAGPQSGGVTSQWPRDGGLPHRAKCLRCLGILVRPARLERATSWFVAVNPFVDPA